MTEQDDLQDEIHAAFIDAAIEELGDDVVEGLALRLIGSLSRSH